MTHAGTSGSFPALAIKRSIHRVPRPIGTEGYVDAVVGTDVFVDPPRLIETQIKRVLVVDDAASMRKIISRLLTDIGVPEVVQASSASEAFKLLHDGKFNLLITDVEMPEVDGIKLLLAVRRTPLLSLLPVIMVTTRLNVGYLAQAKNAYAEAYLIKPFSADHLRAKMLEAISRRHKP